MKLNRINSLPRVHPAKNAGVRKHEKTDPPTPGDEAVVSSASLHVQAARKPVVQPLAFDPLVVEGKLVRVSEHGNNAPVLGYATLRGKSRKVVFKQEINRSNDPKQILNNHIKAVVASRIMKHFGVPTVLYYPACMEIEKGKPMHGILSEYVECKNLYEDPSLLDRITNPDQAVRGSIVSAWLGNSDTILNEGNVWVRPDGKVIFGDYGYAFKRRVTALGLPKTNLKLMARYATRENVEPTLREIASLTDHDIHVLVNKAGKGVWGWNEAVAEEIISKLIHNRDELKNGNPFACFYDGTGANIEIDHKVMEKLRNHVRYLAGPAGPDEESPPGEDETFFLAVSDHSGRIGSYMTVRGWQISESEINQQRRIRKEIRSIAKGIPDWNKEIEDQLMVWILYSSSEAEAYFKTVPEHFYPLLKFMKQFFTSEEILGHSLGIV